MSPAATIAPGEASDRLLEAADALFYARGVADVSMHEIRDLSGVSLRRMYTLFPAKADLVTGWLRFRHEIWTQALERDITIGIDAGASPLDALFDAVGAWLTATAFRGCGFINTLAEHGELTTEHRSVIAGHKQALIDLLAERHRDPAALAVLIDGAIVQAAVFASLDPVDAARRAAHALSVDRTQSPSHTQSPNHTAIPGRKDLP